MPVTTRPRPGVDQPLGKGPLPVYTTKGVMARRERSLQMIAERQAEKRATAPRSISKGGR